MKVHYTLYLLFGNQENSKKKIRYVGISRMFLFARKKFIAVEKHSFAVMTTEPTNQTNKSPKKSN